jgi:hypothetical protein
MAKDLVKTLADLKEQEVIKIVEERLKAKEDPLKILEDARKGMEIVGQRFASSEYFTAADVKGVPSWNLTPCRSLNVQPLPSRLAPRKSPGSAAARHRSSPALDLRGGAFPAPAYPPPSP